MLISSLSFLEIILRKIYFVLKVRFSIPHLNPHASWFLIGSPQRNIAFLHIEFNRLVWLLTTFIRFLPVITFSTHALTSGTWFGSEFQQREDLVVVPSLGTRMAPASPCNFYLGPPSWENSHFSNPGLTAVLDCFSGCCSLLGIEGLIETYLAVSGT